MRVFLPPDARAIEVEGLEDLAPLGQQFGRVVIAGYLPLSPGEGRKVTVRYVRMPGEEEKRGYHLFLQKQAGLECRPTSVSVRWPDGRSSGYRGCPTRDSWVVLDERVVEK